MAGTVAREEPDQYPSNIHCHHCEEMIFLHDECVLCQVVRVVDSGDEYLRIVVFDDDDPKKSTEPQFSPIFLHEECWDMILEEMQESLKNDQPIEVEHPLDDCAICGSDFLDGEIAAAVDKGELIMSPRQFATVFDLNSQAYLICPACLTHRNEELQNDLVETAFWPDVSQEGECGTCQRGRCWRDNKTCRCACHTEERS